MYRREFLAFTSALLVSPSRSDDTSVPAILDYERKTGGHIGFYLENTRTGAVVTWRAHQRFVMCSTFKASLAAAILSRVDRGEESLERMLAYTAADIQGDWWAPVARDNVAKGALSVRDMCAAAVSYSDNTCANVLLARLGGPGILTAYWRQLGDRVTRLDDNEPALNRTLPGRLENTTTPAAMSRTLRQLTLGNTLSPPSRAQLIDWLVGCQTGFNRLRAGIPARWRVGDKTGNNGEDAAGDLAIIWPEPDIPIIASVYTRGGSPTPDQLAVVFAAVGRLAATRLYKPV